MEKTINFYSFVEAISLSLLGIVLLTEALRRFIYYIFLGSFTPKQH